MKKDAYTGTLSFAAEPGKLFSAFSQPAVVIGLALIVFAVAFKLSLAPFHKWIAGACTLC